ncbi:putative peptidyl-tRNA hydrolase 2 [Hypsibius exemplaris]|uniref:peptidyl-tRNA hydrolase n=1 Tax=Hypsibius exemplaris TaxID=2072580 RepID=A0A1W0X8L7_HYPEX|nr:putative peptidyl-tRNA hydrolase 2 [Hypsibius exemplaris]
MAAAGTGFGFPTSDFQPKQDCLRELISMGFDQETSTQALFYTGNNSSDAAVSWIFDSQGQSPQQGAAFNQAMLDDQWGDVAGGILGGDAEEYKMVIVVNAALNMSAGKVGAQCAHAAVGVVRMCAEEDNNNQNRYRRWAQKWNTDGEVTIVLAGDNAPHLESLERRAKDKGLIAMLVSDAGRTEVAHGAKTALCVFGEKNQVDSVTGTLKTL